jgi:hypothetical protein
MIFHCWMRWPRGSSSNPFGYDLYRVLYPIQRARVASHSLAPDAILHMPNTWITDLTHFLAPDGSVAPQNGPAKRLADYLTRIVVDATVPIEMDSRSTVVRCRRRPGRRPCVGEIETDIDSETEDIDWWCSVCGEQGSISHWKDSLWDCTHNIVSH